MKLLPALFVLAATACTGVEKPVVEPVAPIPEAKSALSEAGAFEKLTETVAKHPALAGYLIKVQLGKQSWEKDRRKEAPFEAEAGFSAIAEIVSEAIEISAAKQHLSLHFTGSHPQERLNVAINIHP